MIKRSAVKRCVCNFVTRLVCLLHLYLFMHITMEFLPVVLAAGKGSRMTDLTNSIPKTLLPVGNKPMVWYSLHLLEKSGFEEAIIIVEESVKKPLMQILSDLGMKMKITFSTIPDESDIGTADSLRQVHHLIKTKDVMLISGDLITDISLHWLADIHRTHNATVTALFPILNDQLSEIPAPGIKSKKKLERDFVGIDSISSRLVFLSSESDFEEHVNIKKKLLKKHPLTTIYTKLVDAHLYLIKKWVLDYLEDNKSISSIKGELIPYLVKKQLSQSKTQELLNTTASISSKDSKKDIFSYMPVDDMGSMALKMSSWNDHRGDMDDSYHSDEIRCYGYILDGGFCMRVNTLGSYCEGNRQIPRQISSLASDRDDPLIHPTANLMQKSQVGNDCIIGMETTMADKVSIKKSVIGSRCSIGEKVKIINSVIMNDVIIREGSTIQNCIICDKAELNEKCDLKDCLVGPKQVILTLAKATNETIVDIEQMMEI